MKHDEHLAEGSPVNQPAEPDGARGSGERQSEYFSGRDPLALEAIILPALRLIRDELEIEERNLAAVKAYGGRGGWWEVQAFRHIMDDAIRRMARFRRRVDRCYPVDAAVQSRVLPRESDSGPQGGQ